MKASHIPINLQFLLVDLEESNTLSDLQPSLVEFKDSTPLEPSNNLLLTPMVQQIINVVPSVSMPNSIHHRTSIKEDELRQQVN